MRKSEFIMDFWYGDDTFVTWIEWNMWIQKICYDNVKNKIIIKWIILKIKHIETFLIQKILIF
jgi:hypothetical protein